MPPNTFTESCALIDNDGHAVGSTDGFFDASEEAPAGYAVRICSFTHDSFFVNTIIFGAFHYHGDTPRRESRHSGHKA